MKELRKKNSDVKTLLMAMIPLFLFVVIFFFPRFVPSTVADQYCRKVFPVIALPANMLNGCFHISLTENIVVTGGIFAFFLIIAFLVAVLRRVLGRGFVLRFILRVVSVLLIIATVGCLIFQLMHGMNYRRTPVKTLMRFDNSDYSIEAYNEALYWAYTNMIYARRELGEDYRGVAHMTSNFEEAVVHANYLVDDMSKEFNLGMSTNFVRAKPVSLSKYWSLTRIVGMYDPFLGEANINTGYLDITDFGHTVCHELAHAKGFASETDCNIIAAIACTRSYRADFRYAGYLYIYRDLFNVVYNNSVFNDGDIPSYIKYEQMAPVYRDLEASGEYWDMIEHMFMSDEIAEVSESANDSFLRVNGDGGIKSYQVPEDVYVDYYMTYIKNAEAEDARN